MPESLRVAPRDQGRTPIRRRDAGGTRESETQEDGVHVPAVPFPPPQGPSDIDRSGGYCAGAHLFPFRTEKLSPAAPFRYDFPEKYVRIQIRRVPEQIIDVFRKVKMQEKGGKEPK